MLVRAVEPAICALLLVDGGNAAEAELKRVRTIIEKVSGIISKFPRIFAS